MRGAVLAIDMQGVAVVVGWVAVGAVVGAFGGVVTAAALAARRPRQP